MSSDEKEDNTFKYVTGQKRKRKLYSKGYFYLKEREGTGKSYWKCDNYKKHYKKRVVVCNNQLIAKNEHNHKGNLALLKVNEMMTEIKSQAFITNEPPRAIIAAASTSLTAEASTSCPSISSMSRTIGQLHEKNIRDVGPSTPLDDLIIPDKFKKTKTGENFLIYDSKDKDRLLIFATERNLQLLNSSQQWFMDGTFNSVPSLFHQLLTIHGEINGQHYPLIYALMPNKTQKSLFGSIINYNRF